MKTRFIIAIFCLSGIASPALANDASLMSAIDALSHGWAKVNYQTPKKARAAAFQPLISQANSLLETYPDAPEAMIMDALILSSTAAVEGGVDALIKVREARELLLHAEKINPQALDGAVYTCLGSLYAKVPSWPISFGDKDKARKYLKKALQTDMPVARRLLLDFAIERGLPTREFIDFAPAQFHAQRGLMIGGAVQASTIPRAVLCANDYKEASFDLSS